MVNKDYYSMLTTHREIKQNVRLQRYSITLVGNWFNYGGGKAFIGVCVRLCVSVCVFVHSITQQEGWLCNQQGIFWPPLGTPWDNRGKCHMDEKRIQCLSKASQHVPIYIFNRFPVIQPVSSKVRHFSTFFAHFGLPWVRPWDSRGKCYMDGKRIQCWSKHSSIYLSIFNRLWAIARYW